MLICLLFLLLPCSLYGGMIPHAPGMYPPEETRDTNTVIQSNPYQMGGPEPPETFLFYYEKETPPDKPKPPSSPSALTSLNERPGGDERVPGGEGADARGRGGSTGGGDGTDGARHAEDGGTVSGNKGTVAGSQGTVAGSEGTLTGKGRGSASGTRNSVRGEEGTDKTGRAGGESGGNGETPYDDALPMQNTKSGSELDHGDIPSPRPFDPELGLARNGAGLRGAGPAGPPTNQIYSSNETPAQSSHWSKAGHGRGGAEEGEEATLIEQEEGNTMFFIAKEDPAPSSSGLEGKYTGPKVTPHMVTLGPSSSHPSWIYSGEKRGGVGGSDGDRTECCACCRPGQKEGSGDWHQRGGASLSRGGTVRGGVSRGGSMRGGSSSSSSFPSSSHARVVGKSSTGSDATDYNQVDDDYGEPIPVVTANGGYRETFQPQTINTELDTVTLSPQPVRHEQLQYHSSAPEAQLGGDPEPIPISSYGHKVPQRVYPHTQQPLQQVAPSYVHEPGQAPPTYVPQQAPLNYVPEQVPPTYQALAPVGYATQPVYSAPVPTGCPCQAPPPPVQCCAPVTPCCLPQIPCCPPPPPLPCCPRISLCCQPPPPPCCPPPPTCCISISLPTIPLCFRSCPACPCRRRLHRNLRMKRAAPGAGCSSGHCSASGQTLPGRVKRHLGNCRGQCSENPINNILGSLSGTGCGTCGASHKRVKRMGCLPCLNRSKRDIEEEHHRRTKRMGCLPCLGRKKRSAGNCHSCSNLGNVLQRFKRTICSPCGRKKREADEAELNPDEKEIRRAPCPCATQSSLVSPPQPIQHDQSATVSRQKRSYDSTYDSVFTCDKSCCNYDKCGQVRAKRLDSNPMVPIQ